MSVKHTTDKFVSVDRYYISGLHPHIWKHPEGEMVYFDDYVDLWAEKERLKAEVEAYRSASDEVAAAFLALPAPHNQVARVCEGIERLKAENERLRKAGDAMSNILIGRITSYEIGHAIDQWEAAREGKQTEQKSPSFIEDLGNGVEKHDLLFRYPAKEGKQP